MSPGLLLCHPSTIKTIKNNPPKVREVPQKSENCLPFNLRTYTKHINIMVKLPNHVKPLFYCRISSIHCLGDLLLPRPDVPLTVHLKARADLLPHMERRKKIGSLCMESITFRHLSPSPYFQKDKVTCFVSIGRLDLPLRVETAELGLWLLFLGVGQTETTNNAGGNLSWLSKSEQGVKQSHCAHRNMQCSA